MEKSADRIKHELEDKITATILSGGSDYLIFVKQDDATSKRLAAFVKANNISGRIIDIDTDDGFMAIEGLGIAEHHIPCIYSVAQQYIIYRGCPEHIGDLEG